MRRPRSWRLSRLGAEIPGGVAAGEDRGGLLVGGQKRLKAQPETVTSSAVTNVEIVASSLTSPSGERRYNGTAKPSDSTGRLPGAGTPWPSSSSISASIRGMRTALSQTVQNMAAPIVEIDYARRARCCVRHRPGGTGRRAHVGHSD
jgi:hypothetical protein